MSEFLQLVVNQERDKCTTLHIKSVPLGRMFMANGSIYMRLHDGKYNAFHLDKGLLELIDEDWDVMPVEATLTWRAVY